MHTRQKGFAHPLLAGMVLFVVVIVGLATWAVFSGDTTKKKQQAGNTDPSRLPLTEQKPRLKNLGLKAIAPYDLQTEMSGDVVISEDALREYDSKGLKGFYIFGDKLGNNDNRKNPNFEFASLKPNTPVISSIDGVVAYVGQQKDSNDYEVFLQPTQGSVWTIAYDHLIDVSVLKGTTVRAGDRLGSAAVQGNGLARFELQVNYDKNGKTTHYCPSLLLDEVAKTKERLLLEITALEAIWENFSGKDLYDETAQKIPGCLSETLTPEQAEGR